MLLLQDNSKVPQTRSNTCTILQQFWKTGINRNKTAAPINAIDRSALTQIQHVVLCQFHIRLLARFSFTGETTPFFISSLLFHYTFIRKLTKNPTNQYFQEKMPIKKLTCLCCINIITTNRKYGLSFK